ncbi:MAG: hypothetical protein QM755_04585 [Luteolibacter sp.]
MPVLLVDRDPMLISIDQQRLADLGIPSAVVHEHSAGFYGPRGVMWAALVVPEGWQDALPDDLPVQEEWDAELWARAESDDTAERPEHARPVSIHDSLMASMVVAFLFWCPFLLMTFAAIAHESSKSRPIPRGHIPNAFEALLPVVVMGLVGGLLAPQIGRRLRTEEGLLTISWIVVAMYFNLPGILIVILR